MNGEKASTYFSKISGLHIESIAMHFIFRFKILTNEFYLTRRLNRIQELITEKKNEKHGAGFLINFLVYIRSIFILNIIYFRCLWQKW